MQTQSSKPKFPSDSGFYGDLKRRVDAYFEHSRRSPHASPAMYAKTVVMLAWMAASYALLVFAAATWWQAALCSVSLALAVAGVGFAVQHDANHGATSRRRSVNRLFGLTLDLLGASSYVWHWKHNIYHHTYTNLVGDDDDIALGPLARLAPAQPRHRAHRLQHIYVWFLYGFLLPKWHFFDDFWQLGRRRIGRGRLPTPSGWGLVHVLAGKVAFASWAFVVPMLFHPWWAVLLFYGTTCFIVGVVLSTVFQLAHCVEEAGFPSVGATHADVSRSWAVHEVETTVDFAPGRRLLSWYVGGLNYQIEHHLFPRICHVHYSRLAPIVRSACRDYGIPYRAHPRLRDAISSHWRWLRRMGLAPGTAVVV